SIHSRQQASHVCAKTIGPHLPGRGARSSPGRGWPQCRHSTSIRSGTRLAAREADGDGLNVVEVAALQDALLDQVLQDAPALAMADPELVGERGDGFRDSGRGVHEVTYAALGRPEVLLGLGRSDPEEYRHCLRVSQQLPATSVARGFDVPAP